MTSLVRPFLALSRFTATLTTLGLLAVACGAPVECTDTFPDGSGACDDGPVMATDLEGEWCDTLQCLEVGNQHYRWVNARTRRVMSEGTLTGGLEFNPETSDTHIPTGQLYSASVDWTETGIALFFDDGQKLRLTYQEE